MAKREKEFGVELSQAMAEKGPLCVGIDPHPALLEAWGLSDDAVGLREFSLRVVEAMAGQVAAVKPQSAFFERHGSKGIAVLEQTLEELRQASLLSILDVKRGDIGSTMAGYAQAYLSDESSLAADAITLSPYLGFGSLSAAIELAQQNNRGVFVLDLTSNPEGASVQHARGADGVAVAANICQGVSQANKTSIALGQLGSIGMVVGATVGNAVANLGLDLAASGGPLLAPGVGAQGAGAPELEQVFANACPQVLASTSRGVLKAGPKVDDLREAAKLACETVRNALQ